MQSHKPHLIDITSVYPCPCRRRGRLEPIALTEAFGCQRCQQIFTVNPDQQILEQLSTSYPKRLWRWNGSQWIATGSAVGESLLPVILGISLVLLSIGLPMLLNTTSRSADLMVLVGVALLIASLSALMVILAYRR